MFCGEINLRNENFERKHFEFGFFVARVKISMKSEQINLVYLLINKNIHMYIKLYGTYSKIFFFFFI